MGCTGVFSLGENEILQTVTKEQAVSSTNLNDVLNYIRTASHYQRRVIQIAVEDAGGFILPRKAPFLKRLRVSIKNYMNKRREGILWQFSSKDLFKCLGKRLFYVRSFMVNSLSEENIELVMAFCNHWEYSIMDIRFERYSHNYFVMLHLGDDRTYTFYRISNKELVGGAAEWKR